MPRKLGPGGRFERGPLQIGYRPRGGATDVRVDNFVPNARDWVFFEDFNGAALNVTDGPFKITDTSAAGTPTYVNTAGSGGRFVITLDNTNEVQDVSLHFNDVCNIPGNGPWYFETRCSHTGLAANIRSVWGLADAKGGTYDNVPRNIWFRLEASFALLVERDDTSTDTDDQAGDEAKTITTATDYIYGIEKYENGYIDFRVSNSDGQFLTTYKTLSGSGLDSTGLQPFLGLQKASGTGVPTMSIDYVGLWYPRF